VVEALFDNHHTHVHEYQEVVHILCIPEEKEVYDSLALLQQVGDNHTGHLEEVFEETHHETGADLEKDVRDNPAVVCDQLRGVHNGGDAGVKSQCCLDILLPNAPIVRI